MHVETRTRTFIASAALAANRRVRLDASGKIAYSAATDTDCIGITRNATFAADEAVAVDLVTAQGTLQVETAGAVLITDTLYAAAAGKVDTSGSVLVGDPCAAASGSGSIVEFVQTPTAVLGAIARSALTQDALKPYTVTLNRMGVAATLALLGASAGTPSGAFGLTPGTHGSATPKLIGEAASGNAKSDACRFLFTLPAEYDAAETITLRVRARVTGLVQVSETIDAAVFKSDNAAGVGSDLCTTAAQTLTASFANYDFTVTPAGLAAGDTLDILLTGALDDTGGTANKLIEIGAVQMLLDVKG